ncbi:MAG: hypothetical protein RLO50_03495 [Azospirillaceae bacterium]
MSNNARPRRGPLARLGLLGGAVLLFASATVPVHATAQGVVEEIFDGDGWRVRVLDIETRLRSLVMCQMIRLVEGQEVVFVISSEDPARYRVAFAKNLFDRMLAGEHTIVVDSASGSMPSTLSVSDQSDMVSFAVTRAALDYSDLLTNDGFALRIGNRSYDFDFNPPDGELMAHMNDCVAAAGPR